MPIHVGELTSEVAVTEGGQPLNDEQTERLVQLVIERLEQKKRQEGFASEATAVRREARPPFGLAE